MWFKVDDQLALHMKALKAGNQALGLWVRAGSWAGAQLTDGYVPDTIVKALDGTRTDTTRLVQAGLWGRVEGGYQFHEWHEYQPTRAEVMAERAAAKKRMQTLRAKRDK